MKGIAWVFFVVVVFIQGIVGVIITPIVAIGAALIAIVVGIIAGIVTAFTTFWGTVVKGPGRLRDRIRKWGKDIKDSVKGTFIGIFNSLIRKYNDFVSLLSFTVPDWVPGIGGRQFKMPQIREIAMAKGGIVKTPTRALIGEAGPEAVIPLNRMKEMGGLGTTINVNIDVSGVTDRSDKRALAREISDLIAQEMRRNGGAPTRGRF